MSEENGWLGRRLAVAGATILTAGAVACGGVAWGSEAADASGDASQLAQAAQAADAQGTGGAQVSDASEVAALSSATSSNPPADVPEGENPRPGMDSVGAPEKRPGAQEGEELAPAVKVAPECDPDGESLTLWVWAASMNVDPEITLRQLNAWRAQAAQNGITDGQGEAVTGEALTWSDSLAYAAQEIAVEIALGGGDISVLDRLDGSGSVNAGEGNTFFKKTNIVGASVRTSLTSVQGALDEWYVQSDNYWAGNTSVAGDYAAAISNKARSVGMAAVMLSNEEVYIVCLYGDAVPEEVGDTTYELTTGSAIYQGVNVRRDYLALVLDVPDTCTAGKEVTLGLRASTSLSGNAVSKDMGVAIDSQAIFDEATIQVVQDGQVVGEVRKGVLQAEDGFASGEATVEVVVGGSVLAQAQTTLQAVPENVAEGASFDASVASGGAVELPQTAEVVWSGGSVSDEPVTWDALTDEQAAVVAGREGGTFEVEGVVEATGEAVSSTVTVEPATMVSAEVPGVDAVWVGGTPVLPETLTVTWSNGDVTDEAVTWQLPDTSQPGCVQAVGTVEGLEQEVLADVEVRALEVAGIDESGLTAVQVDSGASASDVSALLPGSVPVTWSDGSVTDEAVTWDALTAEQEGVLASREGGQFELQGTVGQTGRTVSVEVVVAPAVAVSVEAPASQEVWQGGKADLPGEVAVTWSNGDVTQQAVTWDDVDTSAPGAYEVQGSVEGCDQAVSATVEVKALEPGEVNGSAAVEASVPAGASASEALAALPQTVPVTWSDGSTTDEPVAWDALTAEQEDVLSSREGGTVEVQGAVGDTGKTVSATVEVEAAQVTSVEAPASQEVWQGGKVELPTEVAVTWSNGDETQQAVTWGDVDTTAPGTYEVQGSVEGCDQAVSATVEVKALEAGEIDTSTTMEASVASGASQAEALAALPQTVTVTWSDGSVTDEPVAWDTLSSEQEDVLSSREGGTVEVQGAVGDTGQTVSATVEVAPAQVESVEDPQPLSVESGSDPELPAEVAVTWSNGDVTDEPVTWDALTAEQESTLSSRKGGTVEVQGSVDAADTTVTATVDVQPAQVVQIEEIKPVSVEVGGVAKLPSQVSVTWSNGDVTIEPVTWDDVDTSKAGSYKVRGTLSEGDAAVSATVQVASDGQAATTPASGDATAAGTTPASESAETPAASESSSKPAASSWTGTPASSTAATPESSDTQHTDGLPGWLIATIAGIGAALVAAGAFIVGKRSSSHDDDEPRGKHAAK